MNYLSSEYFYILKFAFLSNFWFTTLCSAFSIIGLILSLFLIGVIIYYLYDINKPNKKNTDDYYTSRGRMGAALIVFFSFFGVIIFSVLSYLSLPESFLQFDKKYVAEIYNIYNKKNIERFEDDSSLVLMKLQYGAEGNVFKTSQEYEDFSKSLLEQIPNNQVVYRKDVAKILNSSFVECLKTDPMVSIKEIQNITTARLNMQQIKDLISQGNKYCLEKSVQKVLKYNELTSTVSREITAPISNLKN